MVQYIRAVAFDFDGTLIDSESTKAKVMAAVFAEMYDIQKGVAQLYYKLIGHNREEKIDIIFKKHFKRLPTSAEHKKLSFHFGEHYLWDLHTCPLFEGVDVLDTLFEKGVAMYLLSLENTPEVKKLARRCGLKKYFIDILGGPISKQKNLRELLKKYHPQDILYVGDLDADVRICRSLGIPIVKIGNAGKLVGDYNYKNLKDFALDLKELQ